MPPFRTNVVHISEFRREVSLAIKQRICRQEECL